ncbi:unnamed protein product [Closterium sp. Yama58-4]|nr:unnamed protein product [Closterium sp. Yama58-4]
MSPQDLRKTAPPSQNLGNLTVRNSRHCNLNLCVCTPFLPVDELNALSCTFEGCASSGVYHQHCIEAFLKSIRLDKQRKTGFQCPRGNGKATKFDKPCPGRITKSHPIHARNENSKKRRKAKMPEPPPAPVGAAGKKGGKSKDDKKADSKSGDGKKEGKTSDSKKEGKAGDGSKSKGSFSVPSSSSKTSTSLPAAPAPKPTVALLVRSSLPPAAKAAASVAKSASGGAGPTSPSTTSGGIGASGGGSGSGGVPVKVLSKSWSAAAAGLKDAAAAAVGAVGSSSGSGGGSGPANAWSSSPGIVSGPSKGKNSESKAEKISSPKDTSLQQDATTGGKASDKPAAGGTGAEEKSRKDKSGSKAASQEGEGKAENGSNSGSGKGSQSRQKKKGKEQSVPVPAVPAPVTAAVPANSVWKAKPAALLLRPEAGKAQAPSQQQAQQQKQPSQQQQQQPQEEQQQQGKQAGRATTESQGKADTTVTSSPVPPPPIKTTTTVSPEPPPPSSTHLPSSTSLSVWTKESSSLHSASLHSSLHPAPPSSSTSSSSTPTECEFSTTSGLSSPPSSFPSTPRAMASLSPSASMGSCADHLPAEPVTEPASSPAEPVAEPSVVGSETLLSGEGSGSGRAVSDVGVQEGLRVKADPQAQQQQQQQPQQQKQLQQQPPRNTVLAAEGVAAGEAGKHSNVTNPGMGSVSVDGSAAADNAAASVGAAAASAAAIAGSAETAGAAPAVSSGLRPWSDACRFALETNRRRVYVRQLQELGFPLGEAAQAVLVHGGDLGGCLNHLLVYHECSCRPSALSAFTPSPFVDISLELQALSEIMSAGKVYVPESIGRLWGASGGAAAGMAAQDDSQWLCGVNSDRSSGTASGLSSCSNSSHGYSQYSEEEGLGDSLLLLPGDEEDLFSRILPGLLG